MVTHIPVRYADLPMLKIAIVTNEPPPYRVPIFNRIARMEGIDARVIFFAEREPNRHWNLPPLAFEHEYLRERFITVRGRYIHNNPDIFFALRRFSPQVIVNDGLNPTNLYAFAYAYLNNIAHVPLTDGTDVSEQSLSKVHKWIRQMVYRRSKAFLYASLGGLRLYQSYGVDPADCYRSHLCIDNEAYMREDLPGQREYDLIFCGRMVREKSPRFVLEVATLVSKKLGRRVSLLFVGSGDEEASLKDAATHLTEFVDVRFHGFARQEELPALYRSARIFLFPTLRDVWGVVANEACAAGLPIIVSPFAGVNGELVVEGENGFICPLDQEMWATRTARLLQDRVMWDQYSQRSLALVKEYTFTNAAAGMVAACRHALSSSTPFPAKHSHKNGPQSV